MQENTQISKGHRLRALLGLGLLQKTEEHTAASAGSTRDCPDEEMIACYFDDKLSAAEKNTFIEQLTHCPQSYSLWVSMLDTLGYAHQEASSVAAESIQESSLYQDILSWFRSNKMVLSGAVATTFLFTMVINITFTSFNKLPIDEQIVKIWQNEEVLDLAYIDVSEFTSIQGQTKSGFNVMPFPEKVAFSSGFKKGLINMSSHSEQVKSDLTTINFLNSLPDEPIDCKSPLCQKENALNYQLGIWSSFVLQECQKNHPPQMRYWKKQTVVIRHFMQEYQHLPHSNTLINRVNEIGESLQSLSKKSTRNKNNHQLIACNNIKQLTLYSIQGL